MTVSSRCCRLLRLRRLSSFLLLLSSLSSVWNISLVLGQGDSELGTGYVFENELIKPEEIFDFEYSTDSDVPWTSQNVSKYYCIFRSLWTSENQPTDYPVAARWGDQLMYSGTKQFFPFLKNRATTLGVEKAAESGFTDTLRQELVNSGMLVKDVQYSEGFTIDQKDWATNYRYLPGGLEVDMDNNFLSGIAGIVPSPCWFTGFYLFDVIDEYDRTYWERFRIKTYPWNAGTDRGQTYAASDWDLDPPETVQRIKAGNAPGEEDSPGPRIFVGPDGEVGPVAEWDCALRVCPLEDPDCGPPENWPPSNYCDRLKYPGCEVPCDPTLSTCEECKRKVGDVSPVFYKSCCESNYEPLLSDCVGYEPGSTTTDNGDDTATNGNNDNNNDFGGNTDAALNGDNDTTETETDAGGAADAPTPATPAATPTLGDDSGDPAFAPVRADASSTNAGFQRDPPSPATARQDDANLATTANGSGSSAGVVVPPLSGRMMMMSCVALLFVAFDVLVWW